MVQLEGYEKLPIFVNSRVEDNARVVRAIINQPRVVLLDESSCAGFDCEQTCSTNWRELQQRLGLPPATHDQEEALP